MTMNPYEQWIRQAVAQTQAELKAQFNGLAGQLRQQAAQQSQNIDKRLGDLAAISRALEVDRTGTGIVRVEDIPGRRVPFDMLVDIPIGNNTTALREGSVTISQEGPFVAVKRYATFQSALEFQVSSQGGARFSGRSFGRYRPIHSAWDINDSHPGAGGINATNPLAAGTLVAFPELPGSMSAFRTMEFDGRITVENAGSSYPRQNISVPSTFWSTQINSPQDLGALDFFERGEVITFRVQPNHVNNPPAGNVNGIGIFGVAGWPFLDGQYDRHEGILTPAAFSVGQSSITTLTNDTIQRLPDGILTLGFLGYRIQQPVGPLG